MKTTHSFIHIYIHWDEFCGPVERTEISLPEDSAGEEILVYKYHVELRGYNTFTLYKSIDTLQWLDNINIHSSISNPVIYYTKRLIDEYEVKHDL